MRKDWSETTRRWLARLSFSFLVVAFFLGWEGYKRYTAAGGAADWRTVLDFTCAAASAALALGGLRQRYR